MVLELLTAYGLIIGTIVGAGQALQAVDAERAALSSHTPPEETTTLEEKTVPIDRLTGVSGSDPTQEDASSETVVFETQSDQGKPSKNLVADTSGTQEEMTPTPVSLESDPVETVLKPSMKTSDSKLEKPYDVFEAVGYDDKDDDLEQWAK